METTVKQRLIYFIKSKGFSQGRFEKEVGLSNGFVNNISKGIGADKLQRILRSFPDLNQSWLLNGECIKAYIKSSLFNPGYSMLFGIYFFGQFCL